MNILLGRGLAPASSKKTLPVYCLNFATITSIPDGFTHSRSGSAWYQNMAGYWQVAAANTGRYQASIFGLNDSPGLLLEAAAICRNTYARPSAGTLANHFTATTGITIVTEADNPFKDLSGGTSVWNIDNSGGGSPLVVEWAGTCANTNKHSGLAYIKVISGTAPTLSIEGSGTQSTGQTVAGYTLYRVPNVTPSSGHNLRLSVPAGAVCRVAGANLQEYQEISSFIDTAGAIATRNSDEFYRAGANSADFYNEAAGTVLFDYTSSDIDNKGTDIFEWSNTGTATDFFRAYLSANNVVIFARSNNVLQISDLGTAAPIGLPRGQRSRFAMPYAPNNAAIIKEGLVIEEDASFTAPRASVLKASPTLTFLNRRTGSSIIKTNGIVHHFAYYDERLSNTQCMAVTNPNTPGEVAVAIWGDDNLARWASHFSGAVQAAFKSGIEGQFSPVYALNKASASSSCTQVAASVTGGGYWLATAGTNGTPLEAAISTDSDSIDTSLLKLRRRIDYIIVNHGLFDAIGIKGAALSGATFETRMGVMLDSIKTQLGPQVKFVLQTPLSYNDAADTTLDDASLQAVRKAQLSLAASRADIIGFYDAYDSTLVDASHADQTSYTAAMNRAKNIILAHLGREALLTPPVVTAASYNASSVVLTLDKPVSGTEYGIFRITDDGADVAVSGMNINGTALTLTLATPIAGGSTVKLWVAYGKMDGITPANVPKSTNGYPVRAVDEWGVSEG